MKTIDQCARNCNCPTEKENNLRVFFVGWNCIPTTEVVVGGYVKNILLASPYEVLCSR